MNLSKRILRNTVILTMVTATATVTGFASESSLESGEVTNTLTGDFVLASDKVDLTTPQYGLMLDNANVTIGTNQTLTLTSNVVADYDDADFALGVVGNLNVNEEGMNQGKLVLDSTGYATLGVGSGAKNIYVEELFINADKGSAVLAYGDDCVFDAKKITVQGGATVEEDLPVVRASDAKVTFQNFDTLNILVHEDSIIGNQPAYGVEAGAYSEVKIKGKDAIICGSQYGAIHAYSNGKLTIDVDTLTLSARKGARTSEGNYAVICVGDSTGQLDEASVDITAKKDITILSSDTLPYTIYMAHYSTVNIDSLGTTRIDGDVLMDGVNVLNVNFSGEKSYLTGNVTMRDSNTLTTPENRGINNNTAEANLSFTNKAVWNNKGNSNITSLTSHGGIVNLGNGTTVTVRSLDGDRLTLKTDSLSSRFTVTENPSDTNITVNGTKSIMNRIETDPNPSAQVHEVLADLKDIVIGSDVSHLTIDEGMVFGEITADVENGNITNVTYKENTSNAGLIDMFALSLMNWRSDFDDLYTRLDDLRNNREEEGIWTHFSRGESSYRSAKNQFNVYKIGYDRQVSDWTVGILYSYTDGSTSFIGAKGDNRHHAVSLYGTKRVANSAYLDLIAKYGKLDYEYSLRNGFGHADYDTDAYAVSAELGKRIKVATGMWIDPQIQITYGNVDRANFRTAQGIHVHQNRIDSLVARAGIMAGRSTPQGDIYLRASCLYDFQGEVKGTFRNNLVSADINRDLGGGWWEVGAGIRMNLHDNLHFYLDFEKAFAGEVNTDWKWNTGVRYSF